VKKEIANLEDELVTVRQKMDAYLSELARLPQLDAFFGYFLPSACYKSLV